MSVSSRRWLLRRFVVHDESMRPTLPPGTGLVARLSNRATVGEIRVVEHPSRPGFWLVKRVVAVEGGRMRVLSDDHTRPTVDSRQLGDLDVDGSYRVVLRVPVSLR